MGPGDPAHTVGRASGLGIPDQELVGLVDHVLVAHEVGVYAGHVEGRADPGHLFGLFEKVLEFTTAIGARHRLLTPVVVAVALCGDDSNEWDFQLEGEAGQVLVPALGHARHDPQIWVGLELLEEEG